jgi:hypothetical protein
MSQQSGSLVQKFQRAGILFSDGFQGGYRFILKAGFSISSRKGEWNVVGLPELGYQDSFPMLWKTIY